MNKIFIKYDENKNITFTHYMPFDINNGLGKSEQELLREGALVEPYDDVIALIGQGVTYKYNPITNSVDHEFFDLPKTKEELEKENLEQQANKISILESENADLLLDSANKDIQMKTLEKDLADLTLIVGGI